MRALLGDRRVQYVLAGSVGGVVYYGLFATGWLLLAGRLPYLAGRLPYLAVAVLANAGTAFLTYPLYRRLVFRWSGPWLTGLLRFYLVCLWSLLFTLVGLVLLVEGAGANVLLAQAVLIAVAPLINYQLHRFWAFRRPAVGEPGAG